MEWSDAATAVARQLFHDGLSARDAALRLGTSRNAVLGKWYRLGLRRKPARACQGGSDPGTERCPADADDPEAPFGNVVDFGSLSGLCASIESLEDGMCSWPMGDPLQPGFSYCGRPALSRGSYCPVHHDRAYDKSAAVRQAAAGRPATQYRRAG